MASSDLQIRHVSSKFELDMQIASRLADLLDFANTDVIKMLNPARTNRKKLLQQLSASKTANDNTWINYHQVRLLDFKLTFSSLH